MVSRKPLMERDVRDASAEQVIASWLAISSPRKNTPEMRDGEPFQESRLARIANRHRLFIEHQLRQNFKKWPSPETSAALVLAGAELLEADPADRPKIIHYWVEQVGKINRHEKGFSNAVLRKFQGRGLEIPNLSNQWATYFSHPEFLVKRWIKQWGEKKTRALLEWNQTQSKIWVRWRDSEPPAEELPLKASQNQNFYVWTGSNWQEILELVRTGKAYIQDPATRMAAEFLNPKAGESVLDLCAAPGGKTLLMNDLQGGNGDIVVVDLPGGRIDLLKENCGRIIGDNPAQVIGLDATVDLRKGLEARLGKSNFEAVLLDAPCTNTGVIGRRPDVKYRLRPKDFEVMPHLQLKLIEQAAECVAPGGRMVYSTCSIDPDENHRLVEMFLASPSGQRFLKIKEQLIFPGEAQSDGAYACLLAEEACASNAEL